MINRNNRIEIERIRREIERHGCNFLLSRAILDQYKERSDIVEVGAIRGIYHTNEGYEERRTSDGTTTSGYGSPMILVMFEDGEDINIGDIVEIGGAAYKVARKNNIMHYDMVYDITLEEVI